MTSKMQIMVLAGINLITALIIVPIFALSYGYARVRLMDAFYELRANNIIDEQRLENIYGRNLIPSDLDSVKSFFVNDGLDIPMHLSWLFAGIFLTNAVWLIFLLWVERKGYPKESVGKSY